MSIIFSRGRYRLNSKYHTNSLWRASCPSHRLGTPGKIKRWKISSFMCLCLKHSLKTQRYGLLRQRG